MLGIFDLDAIKVTVGSDARDLLIICQESLLVECEWMLHAPVLLYRIH